MSGKLWLISLFLLLAACVKGTPKTSPSPAPAIPNDPTAGQAGTLQKIICWDIGSSCQTLIQMTGSNLTFDADSTDGAVAINVTMRQMANNSIASVGMMLRDPKSGKTATQNFDVQDDQAHTGKIEGFSASNGVTYNLYCGVVRSSPEALLELGAPCSQPSALPQPSPSPSASPSP